MQEIRYDVDAVRAFAKGQIAKFEDSQAETKRNAEVLNQVAEESGMASLLDAGTKNDSNAKIFANVEQEMIEALNTVLKECDQVEELQSV